MKRKIRKTFKKSMVFLLLFLTVFFSCINAVNCQAASLVDKDDKWYKSVYATPAPTATPKPTQQNEEGEEETDVTAAYRLDEDDGGNNFVLSIVARLIALIPNLIDIIFKVFHFIDEDGNGSVGAEQIVKGRVGKGVNYVNMFGFELVEGNVYGYIGAKVYVIFRTIILALFAYMLIWELTKHACKSPNAKSYAEFKDFLSTLCVNFLLLFFMPMILEFVLFIRDYLIKMVWLGLFDGETSSLYFLFKQAYIENHDIGSAVMWTAISGSTFVFAFMYIFMAGSATITFFIFPAVCFVSVKNKNLMQEWIGNMASTIISPLIDIVLVGIPALIGSYQFSEDVSAALIVLVQVVFAWLVIPLRGFIRKSLGFGSSVVGESVGLGAFAKTKSLARKLGRSSLKAAKDEFKKAKEHSNSDKEKADMHQKLADAEGNTISDPNAGQYSGISANSNGINNAQDESIKSPDENNGALSSKPEDNDNNNISAMNMNDGTEKTGDSAQIANEEMMNADTITGESGEQVGERIKEDNVSEDATGINNMENTTQNLPESPSDSSSSEAIEGTESNNPSPYGFSADNSSSINSDDELPGNNRIKNLENMDKLNKDVAALQQNKNEIREANAGLKSKKIENAQKLTSQKLALQERNRALKAGEVTSKYGEDDKAKNEEIKENDESIQAIDQQLKHDSAAYDLAMSQNEQMMAGIDSEVARKQEDIKEAKDKEKVMSKGKPAGSVGEFNEQQRRNQILASHANTKNFEDPEIFNALSEQQKADLYRQRSKETMRQARKDAAGAVAAQIGKSAGGIAGVAFMSYGGVEASMTGAMIGEDLGENVGRSAGTLAYTAGGQVADKVASNQLVRDTSTIVAGRVSETGNELLQTVGNTKVVSTAERAYRNVNAKYNDIASKINSTANVVRVSRGRAEEYRPGNEPEIQLANVQVSNIQQRVPNRTPVGRVNDINSVMKNNVMNSSWSGQAGNSAIQSQQMSLRGLTTSEQRPIIQSMVKEITNTSNGTTTKHILMDAFQHNPDINSGNFATSISNSIKELSADDILKDKDVQKMLRQVAQQYGCDGDIIVEIESELKKN